MTRLDVGMRVHLNADGLRIECVVTGTKTVYGRDCVQVQPVAGEGRTWVNAPRVTPVEADEPALLGEAKTQTIAPEVNA